MAAELTETGELGLVAHSGVYLGFCAVYEHSLTFWGACTEEREQR